MRCSHPYCSLCGISVAEETCICYFFNPADIYQHTCMDYNYDTPHSWVLHWLSILVFDMPRKCNLQERRPIWPVIRKDIAHLILNIYLAQRANLQVLLDFSLMYSREGDIFPPASLRSLSPIQCTLLFTANQRNGKSSNRRESRIEYHKNTILNWLYFAPVMALAC